MDFGLKFINTSVIMLPSISSMIKRETNMKLIIFDIVILLSLQGCSTRYIASCGPNYIQTFLYGGLDNKKNEKQCQKDKKILTEILGEGSLW